MKKIHLAYSKLYNAGDIMNVDIVEKLSNRQVQHSRTFSAEMIAIGGAIYGLQYSDIWYKKVYQNILHIIYDKKPIYVWGSGFWHDFNHNRLFRNNIVVCALRGKKTQKKLYDITGNYYDVPLADAGLLIDMLIAPDIEKKYKIGIIPHMSQQEENSFKKMASQEGTRIINIRDTPANVAAEIVSCEAVVSSSLHGLIFADALHIPNLHVLGEKELTEGNFKFEDYYSSYGKADNFVRLSDHIPSFDEIVDNYQIDAAEVNNKKRQLIECFPKELRG